MPKVRKIIVDIEPGDLLYKDDIVVPASDLAEGLDLVGRRITIRSVECTVDRKTGDIEFSKLNDVWLSPATFESGREGMELLRSNPDVDDIARYSSESRPAQKSTALTIPLHLRKQEPDTLWRIPRRGQLEEDLVTLCRIAVKKMEE